jgi:dTDP-4-amino-4,6-dideoxygalactose transaminase
MPVPLTGVIGLPAGDGPAPWVVLLHGRHGGCHFALNRPSQWPCDDPAYDQGLAYLAQGLVEAGFGVIAPNLNAALGCAQLEQLPAMLASKRELFDRYKNAFASVSGLKLIQEPEQCQSNYWLQTLLLNSEVASQRDEILQATNDVGIRTRPAWNLLHTLPLFQSAPRMDLAKAKSLSERLMNIPSSSCLALLNN